MGDLVWGVRAYALLVGMWIRSTMTYRASFAVLTVGQFVGSGLDFVAIALMFSHTPRLGGFDLAEVAFLYGTSGVALGIADLLIGSTDRLGQRVRDGSFDVLLVRPVPVLAQMAADRFALRRVGRITQAGAVLVWSLTAVDVAWTWEKVLLVPSMLLCGAVIFGAVFVLGAAFQFLASDAAEVQNAFLYGGNTLTQYPPTVFAKELVRGVTFLVPLAFVNWMPALHVLGRPDPLGLPEAFDYAAPAVALAMGALAGLAWRAGLRGYRSTGS
ncbi:ABC transporter permease [Streptomyces capparidis]